MTLTGKDALELHERIKRENERKKAERIARAKQDAAARGKEPFDLAKLETMCATEALGRMSPEERAAQLEEMYYAQYPAVLTLAEFAARLAELGRW
jgi:hypothetical protein